MKRQQNKAEVEVEKIKNNIFLNLVTSLKHESSLPKLLTKIEYELNLAPGYIKLLFPLGNAELLLEFENWQDQRMLKKLNDKEKPSKIREKIALALEVRILELLCKDAALNLNMLYVNPAHVITYSRCAWNSCDKIWKYAGDESTDHNYYTKRSLLLSVYISSSLYYYADESEDNKDLKEYIRDALDNIISIARCKKYVKLPELADIPLLRLLS